MGSNFTWFGWYFKNAGGGGGGNPSNQRESRKPLFFGVCYSKVRVATVLNGSPGLWEWRCVFEKEAQLASGSLSNNPNTYPAMKQLHSRTRRSVLLVLSPQAAGPLLSLHPALGQRRVLLQQFLRLTLGGDVIRPQICPIVVDLKPFYKEASGRSISPRNPLSGAMLVGGRASQA